MSRGALIVLFAAALIIVSGALLISSWSRTPFGRLDPRVAVLLKYAALKKVDLFLEGRTIDEVREFSRRGTAVLKAKGLKLPGVKDTAVPGPGGPVPVRIYMPDGKSPFPVVVYYHGGGWVMGDLDTHDNLCRFLAVKVPAVVVSVGYRLAPEHPFPAAVDDALRALRWVAANAASINGDPKRIALAGDSAGGNLAAVTALLTRKKEPVIMAQVLIYPATDLSSFNTDSYKNFGRGYHLTARYMEKFRELYLPNRNDRSNPMVSPLLAADLKGLPRAFVLTAQFDVLRDEGEAYAEKMRAAGVPVTGKRYPGMIHGFITMDRLIPMARAAQSDCADFLRASFYSPNFFEK